MQHESIHLSLSHLGLGLPSLARSLPCLHAPYLALSLTPDRPLAGVTFIDGDSLNTLDVYKFMWCVHFVALVFAFAS